MAPSATRTRSRPMRQRQRAITWSMHPDPRALLSASGVVGGGADHELSDGQRRRAYPASRHYRSATASLLWFVRSQHQLSDRLMAGQNVLDDDRRAEHFDHR